ncbi:MAG: hypothetical protein COA99_11405 [Moraxellaceae bacterium]|nr:MAG: hypothetical protein COA99_11405 [Moraxellaceae bacterium]
MPVKTKKRKKTKVFGIAQKKKAPQEKVRADEVLRLLGQGATFHSQGHLLQAKETYLTVLHHVPGHADANHMLGLLALQAENPNAAIDLFRNAIVSNPKEAEYYNSLGIAFKDGQRPMEASINFKKAMALNTNYKEPYLHLAALNIDSGDFSAAEHCLKSAADCFQDDAQFWLRLSIVYIEKGDIEGAYSNIVKLRAFYKKGYAEFYGIELDVIGVSNEDAKKLYAIGRVFEDFKEQRYASLCFAKAIVIDPDFRFSYERFSRACSSNKMFDADSDNYRLVEKTLLACLERNDIGLDGLVKSVLFYSGMENVDAEINAFHSKKGSEDALVYLITNNALLNALTAPLFLLLLNKTIINDIAIETLLCRVRKIMLLALYSSGGSVCSLVERHLLALVAALAHQGFWNEYVYDVSDEENTALVKLKPLIIEKYRNQDEFVLPLLVLAGYQSLDTCPELKDLVLSAQRCNSTMANSNNNMINSNLIIDNNEMLDSIIKLHIEQPAREREMAKNIRQLSKIDDVTSTLVRQQYEENPYPRWASIQQGYPKPIEVQLRMDVYPNKPQNIVVAKSSRVLIAGCGTGKQPIQCATNYADSSLLAVDLSLASLSYAQRQAKSMGVDKIEFMQADILNLVQLNERFDVIESMGVLHHMKDPLKGLGVLVRLLKPGGLMKIGLYSELARKNVVRARELISEKNFSATIEGIRACRQAIMKSSDSVLQSLMQWPDFYSSSMLRDLIFHTQEHRFTIHQLRNIFEMFDLEFLGFVSNSSLDKSNYVQQYPQDPGALSLDNWQLYEEIHPDCFAGMYKFWVRQRKTN